MRATPIYAALLALLFIVLSIRTIRLRQRLRVAIGDGAQPLLQRAMRVHANFAEYVPIALLLIYFIEVETQPQWLVHALGIALLVGRMSHAYGVSQVHEKLQFRMTGMLLTFGVIILAAARLLVAALSVATIG